MQNINVEKNQERNRLKVLGFFICITTAIWLVETGLTEYFTYSIASTALIFAAGILSLALTRTTAAKKHWQEFLIAFVVATLVSLIKADISGIRGIASIIIYFMAIWTVLSLKLEQLNLAIRWVSMSILLVSVATYVLHRLSITITVNDITFITKNDFFGRNAPVGFLQHPNGFADIISLATVLTLFFAKKRTPLKDFILIAITALIVFESSSRASLVIFFISVFTIILPRHRSSGIPVAILIFGGAMLGIALDVLDLSAFHNKASQESKLSGRDELWAAYSTPLLSTPINFAFGLQGDQYSDISSYLDYGLVGMGPHNFYLFNAAIIGVPALILLLGKLLIILRIKFKNPQNRFAVIIFITYVFGRGLVESESLVLPQTRTLLIILLLSFILKEKNAQVHGDR